MSRFMTTLGRLGMLAGQLDTADKKKKATQKAAAEKQRQFNAELTAKYDLERFKQDQANIRAANQLRGTLGAAMIRANNSNQPDQLSISDLGKLDERISQSMLSYTSPEGTPLFSDDMFDGGDLRDIYTGPFGQITSMVRDQVLAGNIPDDAFSINNAINSALTTLSPQIQVTSPFIGSDVVSLGFGGEVGQLTSAFRDKLRQTPQSEQQALINNFRTSLMRMFPASVAQQIIRIAQQGM